MTDTSVANAPSVRAQWNLRIGLGISTMAASTLGIVLLVLFGDTNNELHKSAHSWAWMMNFAVLGGFSFPAISDLVPWKK